MTCFQSSRKMRGLFCSIALTAPSEKGTRRTRTRWPVPFACAQGRSLRPLALECPRPRRLPLPRAGPSRRSPSSTQRPPVGDPVHPEDWRVHVGGDLFAAGRVVLFGPMVQRADHALLQRPFSADCVAMYRLPGLQNIFSRCGISRFPTSNG
jgi:hypothetical protein